MATFIDLLKIVLFAQVINFKVLCGEESQFAHPSLKERQRLYTLYSSIPRSHNFEEYVLIHNVTNDHYGGKIVEFDTFGWLNGNRQTIYHKLPYLIANPSLRTPHVSKDWCGSTDFFKLGFRIYQATSESGLPAFIKCNACHPIIEGLNTIYFLFPERDFTQRLTKLSISSRISNNAVDYCNSADCEQNPRVVDFLSYMNENDLYFGKFSRWNGEHATTEGDREIMGKPDGELAIHSRHSIGFTTMCGMELNEKVVSSNIFSNVDVVGPNNKNREFAYKDYESIIINSDSVIDPHLGLELFISWDPWGCCSACCCPATICGHNHQTVSDCDLVYSSRSRVGHLSLKKSVKYKDIVLKNRYFIELDKLLSIPPYTSKGIPIFSTLLKRDQFNKAISEVKEKMLPLFISRNNFNKYEFSSGMFVDSESCKSDIQKTDCFEWSRCHNISLAEANSESSALDSDSCHQVKFVDVLVGTENMKVTVGEHQNLRIRIDSEVFDMKTTKALWRINLKKPKKYDKSRPCLLQGVVQRDDEILILNFASWDLKIDLILPSRKVRITFLNSRLNENARVVQYSIFYWAVAIIVFFLLLIVAIIFMHREKTKRLERAIKSVMEAPLQK